MRAPPRGGKRWIAVRCSTGAAVMAGPQHGRESDQRAPFAWPTVE
jgi:hypothetical protein